VGQAAKYLFKFLKMKKSLKKSLIIGMFLLGLAYTSSATVCATVRIFCPDGSGTNGLVCADDYEQLNKEIEELFEVMCEQ
jgi:hypothetical protein